jgi:hypothetical protein
MIPPIAFYLLLARSLTDLPLQDDYHAILGFLLRWKSEARISHILEIVTYQHNDYRCMFENAIFGIQYVLLGHTNLRVLAIMGDLFVIFIFAVLYLIWWTYNLSPNYRLLAFIPVSWILFQLQYESTLNFATSGLQCFPVIAFALLTFFLATKPSTAAFVGALLSFLLAVASYANGLFLIPIGAVLFLQRREYRRLSIWCSLGALASLVYFHGYDFAVEMPNTHMNNIVLSILHHLSLPYAAAFLGSIAAIRDPLPAIILGIILTGVFLFATYDRLFNRNPALYYSSLFIFVTALAVSGLRSSYGLASALGSRYRISSTVLFVLAYLYLAERLSELKMRPRLLKASLSIAGVLLATFTFESDRDGERLLLVKRQAVEAEMLRWERHEPRHLVGNAFSGDLTAVNEENGLFDPIEPFISDSIREGIYVLPNLQRDK